MAAVACTARHRDGSFGNGTVELQVFRGSTNCESEFMLYAVNFTTSSCLQLADYHGIFTCGKMAGHLQAVIFVTHLFIYFDWMDGWLAGWCDGWMVRWAGGLGSCVSACLFK